MTPAQAVLLNLGAALALTAAYGLLIWLALAPVKERLDRMKQDPLYGGSQRR